MDGLRRAPVRGVEDEDDRALRLVRLVAVVDEVTAELVVRVVAGRGAAAAQPDRVGGIGRARLGGIRPRGGHRHVDRARRHPRQPDGVGVERVDLLSVLADGGAAARLGDHDEAFVDARDVEVDARHDEPVVADVAGGHQVVDRAARALDVAHRDVGRDVAGDVDRVAAEPADDAVGDAEQRRLHEELVIALEAVDLDGLDRRVADVDAGAVDRGGRDDDVVGELRAEHDDLVVARAAVDRDGRVHRVLDLVLAAAVRMSSGRAAEEPIAGIAAPDAPVMMVPSGFVCASAKARTTKRSLPSSPSRRSSAWFE